ncbi:hypothetical protein EET67_19135 [Pseudaminobacter arsenicus]|uniref:Uncharacterized protein n=1 Tax=Borborobacter arsenicus TaxID=1851146 RepID=A0A432V2F2_9HYPH|nr:hypothetical protein [Pseudaminobacter arsenicus]RUM96278.1 hypothetical protein EET67_19135 [Pseudaminobacter arsenicus]
MTSDFSAARPLLEQAYHHLQGNDDFSVKTREALDLIIEAIAAEQFRRPTHVAKILEFPSPHLKTNRGT